MTRAKKEAARHLNRAAMRQAILFNQGVSVVPRAERRPHMWACRTLRRLARDIEYGVNRPHPWVDDAMEA
jgi:hypothetical protein